LESSDLFRHVWQAHRLLLDGDKARPPWRLLARWVREYRDGRHAAALLRCRALGGQLDPRWGPMRLECLLHGGDGESAGIRQTLLQEAAEARVSVCPECFAFVPIPEQRDAYRISLSRGRLTAHGYHVEVSERGLMPWLSVRTPRELVFRGKEPGYWLTQRGGWLLLNGPLVVSALLIALGILDLAMRPIWPVLVLFLTAVAIHIYWRRAARRRTPVDQRALDHAWEILAPDLHRRAFSEEDSDFMAGLALETTAEQTINPAKETLQRCLDVTEKAALKGAGVMRHLGALWRLALDRRAAEGPDLGQMIAGQMQRCFEGPLSLSFVEGLLGGWRPVHWTEAEWARTRVLVCERAFEAGFEVADLVEAGLSSPALGRLVGSEISELAQLRLLWSLRPRRPWDRFGSAATAFEVADQNRPRGLFGTFPDLLLWAEIPAIPTVFDEGRWSTAARVALCARGVCFQGRIFTEFPRTNEIVARSPRRGQFELVVGEERFAFAADPEPVANQLERWLRYYFGEFRTQVVDVGRWQSPDLAAVWRARGSVACPDCGCVVLPRLGEMALALDAYNMARASQTQT
jgi:hypothetical protein